MSRASLLLILTGLFVSHSAWRCCAAKRPERRALSAPKVKGDLYMVSGEGGNVAAYVTAEGVVLVDDMFDQETTPTSLRR